jgi:hypothetical protein
VNASTTNPAAAATDPPVDERPCGDDAEAPKAKKRPWWSAPFRLLRKAANSVLRPLRALVKSPVRLAKTIFMATIGKDRGFGFWWLVATIALAVFIGLLVGVLLSPVLGILAAIGVGIWMLIRGSRSSDSDEDESDGAPAPAG